MLELGTSEKSLCEEGENEGQSTMDTRNGATHLTPGVMRRARCCTSSLPTPPDTTGGLFPCQMARNSSWVTNRAMETHGSVLGKKSLSLTSRIGVAVFFDVAVSTARCINTSTAGESPSGRTNHTVRFILYRGGWRTVSATRAMQQIGRRFGADLH